MKESDISSINGNQEHDNYIDSRLGEIKALLRSLFEAAIKLIVAFNAAGIATVASLLGAKVVILNGIVVASVTCFLLGFFACVSLVLYMTFKVYRLDHQWDKDADLWYKDKLTWGDLNGRDTSRSNNDKTEFSIISIGFALPVMGCIFCIVAMINVPTG